LEAAPQIAFPFFIRTVFRVGQLPDVRIVKF